jgi:hypothetical protein
MTVFGVMVAHHARDVDLARVLIKEISIPASSQTHPYIRSLMREVYGGLARILKAQQARGLVKPAVDPQSAAEALFGSYFLGLIDWLSGTTRRPLMMARLRLRLATVIEGLAAG